MQKIFIAGIGTDVGKTIVSAILVEALEADYWKPMQCGSLEASDSMRIQNLISNNKSRIHPETYRFHDPMSPHAAAERDNILIEIDKIVLPETNNHLIIEGVGGIMVPFNDQFLLADLIEKWRLPTILVSNNYLGSINHTLMSMEVLKNRNVNIPGIVFNGEPNPETENIILEYTGVKCLFRVDQEKEINKELVQKYASQFKKELANELC